MIVISIFQYYKLMSPCNEIVSLIIINVFIIIIVFNINC